PRVRRRGAYGCALAPRTQGSVHHGRRSRDGGLMSARSQPLRGCGTALVTPFGKDLRIDEGALRALVDWQIEQGIHFLVPCGSTGEASTMTREEHLRVVRVVAEQAAGRVPVLGGVGGADTRATVEL